MIARRPAASSRRLVSAATRGAPARLRARFAEQYYWPYRLQVERVVRQSVSRGRRVIHISSHSFTPVLDGKVRSADVGLLYHPGRRGEAEVCARWKSSLEERSPQLRVRRNYPYAGKSDGLTAYLRQRFAPVAYVGSELEINQGIVVAGGRRWVALRSVLTSSVLSACATPAAAMSDRRCT